jgi:hypothetical protein
LINERGAGVKNPPLLSSGGSFPEYVATKKEPGSLLTDHQITCTLNVCGPTPGITRPPRPWQINGLLIAGQVASIR